MDVNEKGEGWVFSGGMNGAENWWCVRALVLRFRPREGAIAERYW